MLILVHAGPHFHAVIPMLALVTMGIVAVSPQCAEERGASFAIDTQRA
jgi:hypothetical protein